MKESFAIAVGTVVLLAAGMPLAQDVKGLASNPGAAATRSGSLMAMRQMDEYVRKMQALHNKMMNAGTPEERQKVMDEQRKEMQSGMAMMNKTMPGGGMMGNMGGGMMGQKGIRPDATSQMHMMQKRMDMMQMMMQTMMDQQGMMAGPRNLDAAPKK
jgi:hypothetical protein